jgi:hypothetical protein
LMRKQRPRFRAPIVKLVSPTRQRFSDPGMDLDDSNSFQGPGSALIAILSGEWSGRQVAELLYQTADTLENERKFSPTYWGPTDPGGWFSRTARLTVSANFIEPGVRSWTDGHVPYLVDPTGYLHPVPLDQARIELQVDFPLPPKQLVADFYDTVVIRERRWHEWLPDRQHYQTSKVAIRTWAVGLLNRGGMKQEDAIETVSTMLGMKPVTPSTYASKDRPQLCNRIRVDAVTRLLTIKPQKKPHRRAT